jgi:hypothetical protein
LNYWLDKFVDYPLLHQIKANITLFNLGNRWQAIYCLINANKSNTDPVIEHSCYLLSKIIEGELK